MNFEPVNAYGNRQDLLDRLDRLDSEGRKELMFDSHPPDHVFRAWQRRQEHKGSFKNVVIIYVVVVSYKSEFGMVSINEFKNYSVGNVDSKAPDLMSLWV